MLREVRVSNGVVRGIPSADPRITAFKGIPFAAPPVGELRWCAPQPAEDWEGVRDCARFAPIAMQYTPGQGNNIYDREWHVDPETPMSEDCLYLNVWTGAHSPEDKLPVLVWFFGGGLQCGYPSEMEFDGERLARRGIIVVSVNYRVGVFGFFAHEGLRKKKKDAVANFGSLDQQAGLRWVQENIAAFGGDPDQVTIAGQSAGGGSVLSQMVCPENRGLFHRAVIMSAMIRSPYQDASTSGPVAPRTMEEAQKLSEAFLEYVGASSIDEARKIPEKELQKQYEAFLANRRIMLNAIDGTFQPGDPIKLFAAGKAMNIPVISGNTDVEFLNTLEADSMDGLWVEARKRYGREADTFLSCPGTAVRTQAGYAAVSGIECTAKAAFLSADQHQASAPHYYYRFMPDMPGWDNPGCFHSSDLWFWFETLNRCWRPFAGRHFELAFQMADYFANFVRTGDPNGIGRGGVALPKWTPYTADQRMEMNFTGEGAKPSPEENNLAHFLVNDQLWRLSAETV